MSSFEAFGMSSARRPISRGRVEPGSANPGFRLVDNLLSVRTVYPARGLRRGLDNLSAAPVGVGTDVVMKSVLAQRGMATSMFRSVSRPRFSHSY